jgi:hypothetical protein
LLEGAQTVEAAPAKVKPRPRVELVRRRVEQEMPGEATEPQIVEQDGPQVVEPAQKAVVAEEDTSTPGSSFQAQVRPKGRQMRLF